MLTWGDMDPSERAKRVGYRCQPFMPFVEDGHGHSGSWLPHAGMTHRLLGFQCGPSTYPGTRGNRRALHTPLNF